MPNRRISVNQKNVRNVEKQKQQNRKSLQNLLGIMNKRSVGPSLQEAAERLPKSRLIRTSSFNDINLCDHCEHGHAQKCCLYVYDDFSDIQRYANFKRDLDEPYWITNLSEDFDLNVGHSTPKDFPCYTEAEAVINAKLAQNNRESPLIYLRQYFWPVLLPPSHQISSDYKNHYKNPSIPGFPSVPLNYDFKGSMPIPHPFMPCIMKQIVFPANPNDAFCEYPQVVESHSYVPVPMMGFGNF